MTKDEQTDTRQKGLNKAYGAASTRLRAAHKSEFETYYREEADRLGIDYKPRRTPEKRAEDEMRALIEKFPHLRDSVITDE